MKTRAYVCSHTHWDREWYGTFQQFRMRLVRLTDRLLDLLRDDPEYRYWNFDGQTIVIDDYLEIRPERREELEAHLRSGRITIGPWYVLPDEFLISGESMVRNLQLGFRTAAAYGQRPGLAYTPDMFGHISQMPQLMSQLGLKVAFIWRGLVGRHLPTEVTWRSPDGSEILAVRAQEHTGYCNATLIIGHLPPEVREEFQPHDPLADKPAIAANAMKAIAESAQQRATSSCVLLLNGVDHMEPQPTLPEILRLANERCPDIEFEHATFNGFAQAVLADAKPRDVIEGEQKDTCISKIAGGIVLPNVLSSRIYLKQQNQACMTELERWSEPTSVFAHLLGFEYPEAFLDKAWEWLLKNHPHDSIGGCSRDEVHDQMETRFQWALDIAQTLTEQNLANIASSIDTSALDDNERAVAVFNPLNWPVTGTVDVAIELDTDYLARTGHAVRPETVHAAVRNLDLRRWDGVRVTHQLKAVEYAVVNRNYEPGFATARQVVRSQLALEVKDLPALGYRLYRVRVAGKQRIMRGRLVAEPTTLENKYLCVQVNPNGSLRIRHRATGCTFDGLNVFEDGGDNGDGYTYSPPKYDEVHTTQAANARVAVIEDGPAEAAIRIDYDWELPVSCTPDRQQRSTETRRLPISSIVRLGANSKRVDIETTVDNCTRDHRLRVLFPTFLGTEVCYSEGQFDVVERPILIRQPADEVWKEDQPREYPQQSFCDVNDEEVGLGVINFGLPEFAVKENRAHTICLTLLRAVAYLGAGPFPNTIRGGAGPNMATPGSQCQRTFTFRYSIVPHEGGPLNVQREAHQHNVGVRAFVTGKHNGSLPAEHSFAKADSKHCILSALKKEHGTDRIEARVWNPSTDADQLALGLDADIASAQEVNLLGEPVGDDIDPRSVSMPGKRVFTVALKRST